MFKGLGWKGSSGMQEYVQNSKRVKSVDLHPTEPWILASLHSGTIMYLELSVTDCGEVFQGHRITSQVSKVHST
nr:coatomer subunit beta'-3 [Quercus suber]